ncbi:DUF2986 domain-containing protein [Ferrimonas senticii]|uniref:DUF2986 domain-containing protein n=1 Tax=Ferrimonas senticii TaxID=394566 RepID=UPI00047F79E7|nr:DUF2986 domain-containing protein [Ferrimonas senticii]
MNRKKKVKSTLLKQAKRQRAKNAPKKGDAYVSKAERARLAEETAATASAESAPTAVQPSAE